MEQFRINGKKSTIQLEVIKDTNEGEQHKVLSFACLASNADFLKAIHEVAKMVDAEITDGNVFEKLEEVEGVLLKAFEIAAPGKWDEFYEFLEHDIVNMTGLWKLMVDSITKAATGIKIASADPVIPKDGAQV